MANYASFTLTSLLGILRTTRPDWIFVESPPPTLALPAFLAGRAMGVRVIVNIADLWPDAIREMGLIDNSTFLWWAGRLEKFVYRHADVIAAVTEGVRSRLIQKGVPPQKITFLPNGVDTDLYRPVPPDERLKRELGLEGKHIVLYPGTHGYAHALEHALYAAQALRDQPVHFLFVGDGSEKARLIELSRSLALDNVTFLAPVPPSEIARYLSIALCGLVTQRDIPIFDANRSAKAFPMMASGKPLVYSGRGEGARLAQAAQAGIVVPPENPTAIADAIRRFASDAEFAAACGRNGRAYVQDHLQWSAVVRSWLSDLPAAGQQLQPAGAPAVSAERHS
jgi:colanic acid biosynthesis glycosyl transferase WcaI